jgi:hypothetical protein
MSKLAMTPFAAEFDTPTGSFQIGNQLANFSRHPITRLTPDALFAGCILNVLGELSAQV